MANRLKTLAFLKRIISKVLEDLKVFSGQSYRASMLVNYDSRVVSIINLLVSTTLEHKMLIRLATGGLNINCQNVHFAHIRYGIRCNNIDKCILLRIFDCSNRLFSLKFRHRGNKSVGVIGIKASSPMLLSLWPPDNVRLSTSVKRSEKLG